MQRLVNKIFRRYGVAIKVLGSSGTYTIRGFVQHTATSARKHLLREYTPLGELPQGHYLMLIPLNEVHLGQNLIYNGKWFIVRRLEKVWLGSTAVYEWCLCEEKGEDNQWGK